MLTLFTPSYNTSGITSGTSTFPSPKKFEVKISDIDATNTDTQKGSGRTISGQIMSRVVLRKRVVQIDLEFPTVTRATMASLLSLLNTAENGFSMNQTYSVAQVVSDGASPSTITLTLNSADANEFIANAPISTANDKITISGSTITNLNGTWQLISKTSDTVFKFKTSGVVTAGTYTTGLGTIKNTTAVEKNFIRLFYPHPENATNNVMGNFYIADKSVPLYNFTTGYWENISFTIIEK